MTTPRALIMLALILLADVAFAADLTGAWRLEFKPDFSGHTSAHDCTFKQDGERLAIDCGGQKMSGEVKGRSITFQHKTGKDSEGTVAYSGTIDEKGTVIDGVWRLTPGDRKGRFEARRQR